MRPPDCEHSKLEHLLSYEHLGEPPVECPDCRQFVKTGYDESWDGEEEQQFFWLEVVRATESH